MHQINDLLLSPEWWFTAVIVAIPVGVLGAYIKDWLSAGLSNLSAGYRRYSEKRRSVLDAQIISMVENPFLLITAYIRALALLLIWLFSFCLALAFSILSLYIEKKPEDSPFSMFEFGDDVSLYLRGLLLGIFFLLAVYTQFLAISMVKQCRLAERALRREQKRLGELPPA